jgi:hypothetical protein
MYIVADVTSAVFTAPYSDTKTVHVVNTNCEFFPFVFPYGRNASQVPAVMTGGKCWCLLVSRNDTENGIEAFYERYPVSQLQNLTQAGSVR